MRALGLAAVLLLSAAAPARADSDGPPSPVAAGWRHKRTRLVVKLGSARHSVSDAISAPKADSVCRGKFSYGRVSKDLEYEEVVIWLRAPGGTWRALGRARTDSDGRATWKVPGGLLAREGAYDCEMIVVGDGSRARGSLWVVPRGRKAVVFDVDGTLTTDDGELFEEIFLGRDPEMRPAADRVARHWTDAGYLTVYLTGRPYYLDGPTRSWLHRRGFPAGPVITADRIRDAAPGERIGRFKQTRLAQLLGRGLDIAYAYGDAGSDVCAYARVGIPPERTFILGGNGGNACDGGGATHAVVDYSSHLEQITSTDVAAPVR